MASAINIKNTRIARPDRSTELVASVDGRSLVRRGWQRGMATAEYAVGILAAVALALVLFNIFADSEFVTAMTKFVVDLITKAGAFLPAG